jgi:hypothetical protein
MVLLNCKIDELSIHPEYKMPFNLIAERAKNEDWSGRRDLNSGPPAPKAGVLPLGSPSFSILLLKEKDLAENLVVARWTTMWLGMHGVPRIFPIPIKRRKRGMRLGTEPLDGHALWPKLRKAADHYRIAIALSGGKSV